MTARTPARQAQSAVPRSVPGVRRSPRPPPGTLDDRDISQVADACQAGAAAR